MNDNDSGQRRGAMPPPRATVTVALPLHWPAVVNTTPRVAPRLGPPREMRRRERRHRGRVPNPPAATRGGKGPQIFISRGFSPPHFQNHGESPVKRRSLGSIEAAAEGLWAEHVAAFKRAAAGGFFGVGRFAAGFLTPAAFFAGSFAPTATATAVDALLLQRGLGDDAWGDE